MDKPVYVTKPYLPPFDEFVEGLKEIWDSNILTNMGPIHNRLASKLQEYLKVNQIALILNGHLALEIGIQTLGLKGEVITTPFTFASTTHALVRNGIKPVFCDINPEDYNIDCSKIESLISEKTTAIMPVHVYGTPCDVDTLDKIAKKYNLQVFYDSAHAFGVEINDTGIGNFGDMSMFSFHATKVYNTIEGGCLTFTNTDYERIIYLLKNFGIAGPEDVLLTGTNAKMNEFQALMGLLNLNHVSEEIVLRKQKVQLYRDNLSDISGLELLPVPKNQVKSNYAYFPILIGDKYGISRDDLAEVLQKHNIYPRKYFYPLVTEFTCYKGMFSAETPIAKDVASRVLCLPIWGDIPDETILKICMIIREKR